MRFPAVVLACALAAPAWAQDAPPPSEPPAGAALSRREAVALALEVNPVVRRSIEERAAYRGLKQEAMADALPELKLVGSATRYRDPSLLNSPSFDAFPPELRESLKPDPANVFDAGAELRQTIFSFKLGSAIRAAKIGMELGEVNIERARQEVALATVRAYDDLLLAREKVVVGRKAVRQKEKHLESVRNRYQAGVATELDVLRSEVDLANARAIMLRLEGGVDRARSELNAVLVRPLATPVEPADALDPEEPGFTLEQAYALALQQRPELRQADLNDRIYEQLVQVTRSESRPRLDFAGYWGWSVRDTDNFLKPDFGRWNANVSLAVPVFDGWRTDGRVAQVRAQRAQLQQERVGLEQRVRLQVQEGFDRLQVARSVLQAADLNVAQARRALEMTEANYGYGAATTLDVLDAQASLTEAESMRVQALYEHRSAVTALRYAMGRDPLGPAAETETTR